MTDLDRLIRLNVELEGLLKVLLDRDSIHARSLLAEKFEEYSHGLAGYLAEAHVMEKKVREAVGSGPADETDAATEAGEEDAVGAGPVVESAVEEGPVPETPVTPEIPAEEHVAEEEPAEQEHVENTKLLRAFTLNDKFRFRRELFNGDIEDFADTLSLLAHMPSYAEAVDYLTNDLLWDTRNPNVEDFFAILKDNMPS